MVYTKVSIITNRPYAGTKQVLLNNLYVECLLISDPFWYSGNDLSTILIFTYILFLLATSYYVDG